MTYAHELAKDRGVDVLVIGRENASHWTPTIVNPQGGSFSCGWNPTRKSAIAFGSRNFEAGAEFLVVVEHWRNSRWTRVGLARYRKITARGAFPSLAVPA